MSEPTRLKTTGCLVVIGVVVWILAVVQLILTIRATSLGAQIPNAAMTVLLIAGLGALISRAD